uniref:Uncharacterized protein n=1 Tax=Cacopsylla melanoneura TaxID=428564 RepID=A0A8D9EZG7_9HEMI
MMYNLVLCLLTTYVLIHIEFSYRPSKTGNVSYLPGMDIGVSNRHVKGRYIRVKKRKKRKEEKRKTSPAPDEGRRTKGGVNNKFKNRRVDIMESNGDYTKL